MAVYRVLDSPGEGCAFPLDPRKQSGRLGSTDTSDKLLGRCVFAPLFGLPFVGPRLREALQSAERLQGADGLMEFTGSSRPRG